MNFNLWEKKLPLVAEGGETRVTGREERMAVKRKVDHRCAGGAAGRKRFLLFLLSGVLLTGCAAAPSSLDAGASGIRGESLAERGGEEAGEAADSAAAALDSATAENSAADAGEEISAGQEEEKQVPAKDADQSPDLEELLFPEGIGEQPDLSLNGIDLPMASLSLPEVCPDLDTLAEAIDTALFLSVEKGEEMVYFSLGEELAREAEADPAAFVGRALQISLLGHNFYHTYDDSRLSEGLLGLSACIPENYGTETTEKEEAVPVYSYEFLKDLPEEGGPALSLSQLPLARSARAYLPVKNSEQLIYAVQYGYLPLCEPGGGAEEILSRCLSILSRITREGMSEKELYKAIYQYVIQSVQYDDTTLVYTEARERTNRVFFLEGAVLDRRAVCDGTAKEIVLLSRLMGLEAWHIGARSGEGGHAYVYVKAEGEWYCSCPTYGGMRAARKDKTRVDYHTNSYLLTDFDTNSESWPYASEAHPEIGEAMKETKSWDYWRETAVDIGGKAFCFHPETLEEAETILLDALRLQRELKVPLEVELCGKVDVLREAYGRLKEETEDVMYLSGGVFEGQRLQVYLLGVNGTEAEDGGIPAGETSNDRETASAGDGTKTQEPSLTGQETAEQETASEVLSARESEEYLAFCEERLFPEDLPEEALPRPERNLKSREDFVYALDYLAFYRIGDSVFFEVDPGYGETFFNPYQEFHKAYLESDLADVYACHLEDSYYSRYGVVAVKYSMSRDIATEAPEHIPDTKVVLSFDDPALGSAAAREENPSGGALSGKEEKSSRSSGKNELSLPIEEGDLTPIPCENGEQLYYLAMRGYRPAPVPGSMAEKLYEEAKQVLLERIRPDMTEFEKIKEIYDYLTGMVYYDRETAYSADTYQVREQAYYLEGVFLNHCAVCDGKAKACTLLLNMLGIPCLRETGKNGEADHAWNLVRYEGKWYVLCTTYGQSEMKELARVIPNYAMLLAGRETPYGEDWGYTPQKNPEIAEIQEEAAADRFGLMEETDGICRKVRDREDLEELLRTVEEIIPKTQEERSEYKVEFLYTGDQADEFETAMKELLEEIPGAYASRIPSEEQPVYQVIFLQE